MAKRPAKLSLYQDANGEWRFRLTAANGRQVAKAEEGFVNRAYARRRAEQAARGYGKTWVWA
jgi:uncharacterized protein YegP (UPF0339 family)